MNKTFKYRLYPNKNQERELGIALETHRRLYNYCLNQRMESYETKRISVSATEQMAQFTRDKKTNTHYASINHTSAQRTIRRLERAFQAFFRRVKSGEKPGYPRFKSRGRFNSIEFAYGNGVKFIKNKLRISNVGLTRIKIHRPYEGKIKSVIITRESDKWYVALQCDLGDIPFIANNFPSVGIDVGIKHFITTSNGVKIPNHKPLKNTLPRLRREQRSLNRKKKGGLNRLKQRQVVAAIHTKIKNIRKDFHHKTALMLVRSFGKIAVESLNIQGMLKNYRFAQAISDVGWGNFLDILRFKAESAGSVVIEVNARGTSQDCSGCGLLVKKDLTVRTHDCPNCGLKIDRDVNAAINILARAR